MSILTRKGVVVSMQPVLLATVHHPNVSLPQLKQVLAVVSDSFSAAYLTVSTITDLKVTKLLQTFPSMFASLNLVARLMRGGGYLILDCVRFVTTLLFFTAILIKW